MSDDSKHRDTEAIVRGLWSKFTRAAEETYRSAIDDYAGYSREDALRERRREAASRVEEQGTSSAHHAHESQGQANAGEGGSTSRFAAHDPADEALEELAIGVRDTVEELDRRYREFAGQILKSDSKRTGRVGELEAMAERALHTLLDLREDAHADPDPFGLRAKAEAAARWLGGSVTEGIVDSVVADEDVEDGSESR